MICITGQIESTEWSITQNGTAVCIVIPAKTMQWIADSLSFSIRCAEPHPLSWFVCGTPRISAGLMLSADVMQFHPNYLLNESEPEFYRLCLRFPGLPGRWSAVHGEWCFRRFTSCCANRRRFPVSQECCVYETCRLHKNIMETGREQANTPCRVCLFSSCLHVLNNSINVKSCL